MQLTTDEKLMQENASLAAKGECGTITKTPGELAEIVSRFASSDGWMEKVRLRTDRRWYERVHLGPDYDIWLISWLPGQSTGYHDHGESSGALIVATGILEEHRPGELACVIHSRKPLAFGPEYAHDVRNVSFAPAISIHAYSPPLGDMNEYELDGGRLVPRDGDLGNLRPSSRSGGCGRPTDWVLMMCSPLHAPGCNGWPQTRFMRRWSSQSRYWLIFVPQDNVRLRAKSQVQ